MAPTRKPSARRIEATMLALLAERGTATACPSEVARSLEPDDWRPLMQPVRDVAARLQKNKKVDVYQRGRAVDALSARGPIRLRLSATKTIDYREHPELYAIGRGEQGVLTVEPYKSELVPLWRFATPAAARVSSKALWKKFVEYGRLGDFVGMDMARKFLQMGWTRARRYANHPSGRKYATGTREVLPKGEDATKAESAATFRKAYERARANRVYHALKAIHLSKRAGRAAPPRPKQARLIHSRFGTSSLAGAPSKRQPRQRRREGP